MPRLQTDGSAQKIEIIRSFLERLGGFMSKEEETVPLLRQFLSRFKAAQPRLEEEYKNWQKAKAPNFNIFRALGLARRESKHSRFLAELLDPRASHGQADRFLIAFLCLARQLGLHCPPAWPSEPQKNWEITIEEANESERLDIVVRCRSARFIMVIENKIDAAEGYKQLSRYDAWLQKQKRDFDFRNLIFLTPDVREPKTISMGKCLCVSYGEHIKAWLRELVGAIPRTAPHLQFAIDQYLQIVDEL